MSRQPSANTAPMTPVTPVWADRLQVAQQHPPHTALLPSAFEITPPQTAPRKQSYAAAMPSASLQMVPQGQVAQMNAYPPSENMTAPMPALAMASMPLPEMSPQYAQVPPAMHHMTPVHGVMPGQNISPMMPMMPLMTNSAPPQQHQHQQGMRMPSVPLSFTPSAVATSHSAPHSAGRIPAGRVIKGQPPPKPRASVANIGSPPFAVDFKKRYAAYNQYIMRQAVEETEQSKVIWPPDVELAFMEAVWLVPGVQRHKILVDRRHRGRNELIADYVEYKTGQARTRKQVSSHLQVLKKLLKEDDEFLQLLKPRDEPNRSGGDEKPGPEMAVKSLAHLVSKMRAAKRGIPEPAFLLQAQANYSHSLMKKKQRDQDKPNRIPQQGSMAVSDQPLQVQSPQNVNISMPATQNHSLQSAAAVSPSVQQPAHLSQQIDAGAGPSPVLADTPLLHPKPTHPHEAFFDPGIAPAASVPPEDSIVSALNEPPQAQFKRRHRRTASTSIDLGSDRGLPVVFRMTRRSSNGIHMYTRLLRACYESPTRPKPLEQLLYKFSELDALQRSGLLSGAQVVHANCSLHLAPPSATSGAPSDYSSDVQFLLAADGAWQHRYMVRTVVCSRGQELLRSETPCAFQRIIGRGREQDCEAVSVPFRADFWGDFLNRLEHCESGYATAAIEALAVTQSVYRVTQAAEELCIVGVYEFGVARDEFSARTRFRRVRTGPANERDEPNTPTRRAANSVVFQASPKNTPPRSAATPTQSGPLGTPSFNVGLNLGHVLGYESPAVFGSPRRPIQALDLDVNLSPFDFGESRGSPRASKFEIQRSMTAFEPAAWEDIHDWMFS